MSDLDAWLHPHPQDVANGYTERPTREELEARILSDADRITALEAEVARIQEKYDEVVSERPYIVGWNAGYDYALHGDETREAPDVVTALVRKQTIRARGGEA